MTSLPRSAGHLATMAGEDYSMTEDLVLASDPALWSTLQLDEGGQYGIENLPLFNFNDVGHLFDTGSFDFYVSLSTMCFCGHISNMALIVQ